MARRTITILQDDVDGSAAAETVRFGLDGAAYEIDLSEKNAAKFRDALAGYIAKARKMRGGRNGHRSRSGSGVDNKAVRAWAKSNNVEISNRGRIPAEVIEQYRKAGY